MEVTHGRDVLEVFGTSARAGGTRGAAPSPLLPAASRRPSLDKLLEVLLSSSPRGHCRCAGNLTRLPTRSRRHRVRPAVPGARTPTHRRCHPRSISAACQWRSSGLGWSVSVHARRAATPRPRSCSQRLSGSHSSCQAHRGTDSSSCRQCPPRRIRFGAVCMSAAYRERPSPWSSQRRQGSLLISRAG